MNLAQYIQDTAKAAAIHRPLNPFEAHVKARTEASHERILAALDTPRTANELKRLLGYSNGGMYAMINRLKTTEKIYCVCEIKSGKTKEKLWARKAAK